MTEYQNLIREICEESYQPLREAAITGSEQYRSYMIECAILDDFNVIDICEHEKYKPMFDELSSFACPILYWFEIVSPTSTQAIVKAISSYGKRGASKAIPAIRKAPFLDTNILYVGKVKKGFSGRVVTHLGFYKVTRTQGLQLYYWGTGMKLSLKLHVYTFKNEMGPLMGVIERGMADKLRPLIGKHK